MVAFYVGIPVVLILSSIGARVLIRAREAGAWTDALVGCFFLSMGLGAMPALVVKDALGASPELVPLVMAFGHFMLSFGFATLYIFVWRCFGVSTPWRKALAAAGCLALVVLYVLQGVVESFEPPGGDIVRLSALVRGGALIWALSESLRYWRLMQRRAALGIGDPLVANRFLLWCLWMGSMLGTVCVALLVRFTMPDFGTATSFVVRLTVVSAMGTLAIAAGASLWLAFFAPSWYTRWLSARQPA